MVPDGSRLAVSHRSGAADYLDVRSPDGATVLLTVPGVSGGPVWSPDGRTIAVGDRLVSASTGAVRTLDVPAWSPSWSPDGRRLAFLTLDGLEIADVADLHRQWSGPGGGPGGQVAWSPDGRWLAYEADTGIRFIRPDGGGLTQTQARGTFLGWSADSRAVRVAEATGVVDVEPSGAARPVDSIPADAQPAFGPDRTVVAYSGSDLCPRLGIFVSGRRLTNDCVRRGTAHADRLVASPLSDVIFGLGGADTILGGAGGDVLVGGTGADAILGGGGNDTIEGGPGNDVIRGGAGYDVVEGGPGDDTISGERIAGGPGNDVLISGTDSRQSDESIDALDGERDTIVCGAESNFQLTVYADAVDRVSRECFISAIVVRG